MDMLRTIWPTPFKIAKGNFGSFIIQLIIFLIICAVATWVSTLLAGLPIVGIIFRIILYLMDAYSVIGIVLCVTCFLGITK